MAPGARSKFGAPMFEPEVFRKQMYCIEKSTCDIVRTFRLPRSDLAPSWWFCALGIVPPISPFVPPLFSTTVCRAERFPSTFRAVLSSLSVTPLISCQLTCVKIFSVRPSNKDVSLHLAPSAKRLSTTDLADKLLYAFCCRLQISLTTPNLCFRSRRDLLRVCTCNKKIKAKPHCHQSLLPVA